MCCLRTHIRAPCAQLALSLALLHRFRPCRHCGVCACPNVCAGVRDACIWAYWLTKSSSIDILKSSSTRVACKVIEQMHTVQAIFPFLLMSSPSPSPRWKKKSKPAHTSSTESWTNRPGRSNYGGSQGGFRRRCGSGMWSGRRRFFGPQQV